VSDHAGTAKPAFPADLILVEQSGEKREVRQHSTVEGIRHARDAIRDHGRHLREVKVVRDQRAVARWKADGLSWRRVA
jgi:hypothetical protein